MSHHPFLLFNGNRVDNQQNSVCSMEVTSFLKVLGTFLNSNIPWSHLMCTHLWVMKCWQSCWIEITPLWTCPKRTWKKKSLNKVWVRSACNMPDAIPKLGQSSLSACARAELLPFSWRGKFQEQKVTYTPRSACVTPGLISRSQDILWLQLLVRHRCAKSNLPCACLIASQTLICQWKLSCWPLTAITEP